MNSSEQLVNLGRELLLERLRRRLSHEEQRVLEVLLETCAACRELERQMSALERFEKRAGSTDVPAGFHADLRGRLLDLEQERPKPLRLDVAPWGLLVLACGLLLYAVWLLWGSALPAEWGLMNVAHSPFSYTWSSWKFLHSWDSLPLGGESLRIPWNRFTLGMLGPGIAALACIGLLLRLQCPARQSSLPEQPEIRRN